MANSVDPDQTAPIGAFCSGSTLFASILNSWVMLGNYLQQTTSADDIFRCIFFLDALRVRFAAYISKWAYHYGNKVSWILGLGKRKIDHRNMNFISINFNICFKFCCDIIDELKLKLCTGNNNDNQVAFKREKKCFLANKCAFKAILVFCDR